MKPGGEVQVSDSVSLAHKEWCEDIALMYDVMKQCVPVDQSKD